MQHTEKYKNPLLPVDYSDPDVIRVGEDYFMVSSSFNFTPCIPLLHSCDLVNWRLVNYLFAVLPFAHYQQPRHGEGVWAPSIRYHKGKYYVFFSTPDEGIFMSQTKDPFGSWSSPVLVKAARGWIDPCPFWDEDGRAYLVNAFAKSRTGYNSLLCLSRLSSDGRKVLDEGRIIYDGNATQPTIEGPKIYQRDGYYYIFAPAGGVKNGWQTVLRSRSLYGLFEEKIVLRQGNTLINGPHQGAWVEDPSGQGWFIHFQDREAYGRILHLQPLKWADGWPLIGKPGADGIGEPVAEWSCPFSEHPKQSYEEVTPFSGETLDLDWQWQANAATGWYKLLRPGIRLYAFPGDSLWNLPQLLTKKFPALVFTAIATMRPSLEEGDRCGLAVLGKEYYALGVKKAKGLRIFSLRGNLGKEEGEKEIAEAHNSEITFRLRVEEEAHCFLEILQNNRAETVLSFQASPGLWVGARIGIFCYHRWGTSSQGWADFSFTIDKTEYN
jgi:hypothetical protein